MMADQIELQAGAVRRLLFQSPLGGGESPTSSVSKVDSADTKARLERSRDTLAKFSDKRHKGLLDQIMRDAPEALQRIANNDLAGMTNPQRVVDIAEVIARTDGSRPSFLIRNGTPDLATSPIGTWGDVLAQAGQGLASAIASVGRIDVPGAPLGFMGTGFLVAPDLIVTNRHVLQAIATESSPGTWVLFPDLAIDFGHEDHARASVDRRKLRRVVFAGSEFIVTNALDHTKLDLALIELESTDGNAHNQSPLTLSLNPAPWSEPGNFVCIIGYPGSPPPFAYAAPLLHQLFQSTYGYKRLAPGAVVAGESGLPDWTVSHDATTLGGNSGSVILTFGNAGMAAGLHYGGHLSPSPAVNWGHKLDLVFEETDDSRPAAILKDVLSRYGVRVQGESGPSETSPSQSEWRGNAIRLATMRRLAANETAESGLEASQNGTTPPEAFDGREGYNRNFLTDFPLPIPMPGGDVRHIRRGGSGPELKYEHFSVIMSASRKMPKVTACNIDGRESRRLPRIQSWKFDGRLNADDQWGNDLYVDNDLDKGHMVRREDPIWGELSISTQANIDTFHYTNSCPQISAVNQQIWLGLEDYILGHTREDEMRVSVFTGPFFTSNDMTYRGARIPKSFWKVVAFLLPDGRPSATAYRVSQEQELQDLEFVFAGYSTFQISIRQVADETGIDFAAFIPYDGFSQHELAGNPPLRERIDRLDRIRV
jgi:endonuclease G